MNFIDKLKVEIEGNRLFYKPIIGVGVISGAIYLNSFLSVYGVPFPLDIGVLASALFIIGAISIMLVSITVFYLLLVSLVNLDPFKTNYHHIINLSKQGIYVPRIKNYIVFYISVYFLPVFFLLICVLLRTEIKQNNFLFLPLLTIYLTFPFLYSFVVYKRAFKLFSKKIYFTLKMGAHIFLLHAIALVSLVFFVLIIEPRVKGLSNLESVGVICSFLLVNLICLLPVFSYKKIDTILAQKNCKVTPDSLIKNSQTTPAGIVILVLLLSSYSSMISPYIGESSLRLLNIGGGVEFIAVGAKRQCDSWPGFIISKRTNSTCTTKDGKLVVQFGDRAFALFKDGESEKIVNLNLSKSSIISDIPKGSLYLKNRKTTITTPDKKTSQ